MTTELVTQFQNMSDREILIVTCARMDETCKKVDDTCLELHVLKDRVNKHSVERDFENEINATDKQNIKNDVESIKQTQATHETRIKELEDENKSEKKSEEKFWMRILKPTATVALSGAAGAGWWPTIKVFIQSFLGQK